MLFLINPLAQKEVLVSLEEDIGPHYVSIILLRDNLLELAIHVILLHSLQGLTYREQPLLLSVFGLPLLLSAILFQLVYRPLRLLRTLPIPLAGRYHSLVPLMQSMSRWEHLLILVNVTNFLGVVWLYAWAQHPGAARLIMVYVFCYAFKVLVGLIFNQRDAAETRVKQITGKRLATLRECPICFQPFRLYQYVEQLPCHPSHCFHPQCIHQWKAHNHTCPVCRQSNPPFFDD